MNDQKLITLLLDSLHQDKNRLNIPELTALSMQEWDSLIALAANKQVRLLFYQNLKKRGLEEIIPEKNLHALKGFYTRNTFRNLSYFGELKHIATACKEKNIALIALKGIYLADTIYENSSLREMSDMDLLIPKEDLREATSIMLNMGYQPKVPFSLDWEPLNNHLPAFFKSKVQVEIHWTIIEPEESPKFDILDFWNQAVPVKIAHTDMLCLSPEDVVLYVCFHNAKHHFAFSLRPYCDIQAAILHFSPELDWDKILKRAKKWGWERGIYLSLRLAREFLGAEIPEHGHR